MTTLNDVSHFLSFFKDKMKIYNIFYKNRKKNNQALVDLDIIPSYRNIVLQSLEPEDYSEGPKKDDHDGPDLWVFGKEVKGQEVYIKITQGKFEGSPFCISFHIAEYDMEYPFK